MEAGIFFFFGRNNVSQHIRLMVFYFYLCMYHFLYKA